jgi:hypothetical protein
VDRKHKCPARIIALVFKKVFRDFVILRWRLDLFGRELLAVDGTRIKAVNNKDRNFTKGSLQFIAAADKKLEAYLNRPEHLAACLQRFFEERLGFAIAALSLVEQGQVVEAGEHIRMARPERLAARLQLSEPDIARLWNIAFKQAARFAAAGFRRSH